MKTLFTNCTLADADGVRPGQVLVEDGTIKKVYAGTARVRAKIDARVDCAGLTLMPGFVDTHCHLRDPGLTYKEDLNTGLHAAVKGGFTTVTAMANTKPVTDSAEKVAAVVRRADALGLADVIQVCALTKDFGEDLTDLDAAADVTRVLSNDGRNVDDAALVAAGLEATKRHEHLILATHNQPETQTVVRDIEILREHGGRLHICHISKKDTLDAIAAAKADGLDITCEVTPHHLYASGNEYRVHPPFRTNADKRALIEGARDGLIDTCGTDHAPHSAEDKKNGAPGINNFETAFAMYHTVFVDNGIGLPRLSEMMSAAPARLLGLPGGMIRAGMPADFALVDTEKEWQVDPGAFVSKSRNTPFGRKWLRGQVVRTYKNGRCVYDGEEEAST